MGAESNDERQPPRIYVDKYTDDQLAMLELLGGEEVERRPSPLFFEETPAGVRMIDSRINTHVIRQYMCPVVLYRGELRLILPNGDINTVDVLPKPTE